MVSCDKNSCISYFSHIVFNLFDFIVNAFHFNSLNYGCKSITLIPSPKLSFAISRILFIILGSPLRYISVNSSVIFCVSMTGQERWLSTPALVLKKVIQNTMSLNEMVLSVKDYNF